MTTMSVLQLDTDIMINARDLMVGDVAVACQDLNKRCVLSKAYTISAIMGGVPLYETPTGPSHFTRTPVWIRARVAAAIEIAKPKIIDKYPGQCNRCGLKAYVSAFSVDHEDEAAAYKCPSRRD